MKKTDFIDLKGASELAEVVYFLILNKSIKQCQDFNGGEDQEAEARTTRVIFMLY